MKSGLFRNISKRNQELLQILSGLRTGAESQPFVLIIPVSILFFVASGCVAWQTVFNNLHRDVPSLRIWSAPSCDRFNRSRATGVSVGFLFFLLLCATITTIRRKWKKNVWYCMIIKTSWQNQMSFHQPVVPSFSTSAGLHLRLGLDPLKWCPVMDGLELFPLGDRSPFHDGDINIYKLSFETHHFSWESSNDEWYFNVFHHP